MRCSECGIEYPYHKYDCSRAKEISEYIKEICICAAVRAEDGTIIRGQTHRDCRDGIIRRGGKITTNLEDEGFITSTGRFVDRKEGFELMKAVGWESKNPQGYQLCGLLFSEDLY